MVHLGHPGLPPGGHSMGPVVVRRLRLQLQGGLSPVLHQVVRRPAHEPDGTPGHRLTFEKSALVPGVPPRQHGWRRWGPLDWLRQSRGCGRWTHLLVAEPLYLPLEGRVQAGRIPHWHGQRRGHYLPQLFLQSDPFPCWHC